MSPFGALDPFGGFGAGGLLGSMMASPFGGAGGAFGAPGFMQVSSFSSGFGGGAGAPGMGEEDNA